MRGELPTGRRVVAVAVVVITSLGCLAGCGSGRPPAGEILSSGGGGQAVLAVNGDGTDQRTVARAPRDDLSQQGLAISQDGTHVAFGLSGCLPLASHGGLFVAGSGSGKLSEVWRFADGVETGGQPAWNPAGTELALPLALFDGPDETQVGRPPAGLWVVDGDGSHRRLLDVDASGPVAWSPDGSSIAFTEAAGPDLTRIMVVPATGGAPRTLATIPGGTYGTPEISLSMSWSPGADVLVDSHVLARYSPSDNDPGRAQVMAFPPSGGPSRVVLPTTTGIAYTGATYGPGGVDIAVGLPERSSIEVVRADGTELRQIRDPSLSSDDGVLAWVPELQVDLGASAIPALPCPG